jgi:hypothetical protein
VCDFIIVLLFVQHKQQQSGISSSLKRSKYTDCHGRVLPHVVACLMPRKCKHEGCIKRPSFNFVGERVALYCANHSKQEMVDVFSRFCHEEGCRVHPSFNFPVGTKVGIYCTAHKLDGMIDVKSRQCCFEGCNTFPIFNHPGERPGRFCSKHKFPNMIDVRSSNVSKACFIDGCEERALFNYSGKKGALYCTFHKADGMVSKKKTCMVCPRPPTYCVVGSSKPLYCGDHKRDGMTLFGKPQCKQEECGILPSLKFQGMTEMCLCSTHKRDDISESQRKTCESADCIQHLCFNNPGDAVGRFCAKHREESMVIVDMTVFHHQSGVTSDDSTSGISRKRVISELLNESNVSCSYEYAGKQMMPAPIIRPDEMLSHDQTKTDTCYQNQVRPSWTTASTSASL